MGGGTGSATIASMTVPSRAAAAALLLSLDPPVWALRHARAVAEIAAWLARRTDERGMPVDVAAVDAAALLHDVDKLLPQGATERALPHGEGSAAWLTRVGHPELARLVEGHPVVRLADAATYGRWEAGAGPEERIVAYADKRAGQRLEPLHTRFAGWRARFPETWDDATWRDVQTRAAQLEAVVCGDAGVDPVAVGRLRWTAAALRTARRADVTVDPALATEMDR